MRLKVSSRIQFCLAGVAAMALLASGVQAQETSSDENIVVYQPAFFDLYNPVTALDMVRQVPGFSINDGDQARGFGGTAGNVLIDGERPSTKSTSLREILKRIPVNRVERVELVRGSVAGMDMRGQSRVVNIVQKAGTKKSSTTIDAKLTQWPVKLVPSGEIIHTFQWAKADISIGLQRNAHARRRTEERLFTDASGTLFEVRNARDQREFREWKPHFTMARKFGDGDTLNLNGKYWNWTWRRNRIDEVDAIAAGLQSFDRFDFASAENQGNGVEIGGDYEHEIGEARSIKFIFLQRSDVEEANDLFQTFDIGGFDNATRILSSEANNESILRSVFNWQRDPKNSFEASIEGAYNWSKFGLDISQDNGAGFQTVVLPVSNTKVQERRAEAALSWVTKPTNKLTVETGIKYEISEIKQSGDAANSQEFRFWKPNINLTWNRNERDEFRINFKREVGQLNFQSFATSVDITDSQTNVGNINLRPDNTWVADFAFERKYGEKGVVIISGNYNWISDVRDQIPINNQFDAPGNIGSGTAWHARIEARIPTDRFGLKNGILTLEGGYGDSEVTDPLTGLTREQSFRVDDFYRVDFRQELSKLKLAWGFDYFKRTPFRGAFLFTEQRNAMSHGDFDLFIESTHWKNFTVRLGADNIFGAVNFRERTRFTGPRNLGVVQNVENRVSKEDANISLSIRGTF
jgi:hypothetical protein